MRVAIAVLIAAASLWSQAGKVSPKEQEELESALSEAGNNPLEYVRAIEKHLTRYPDSARRPELERAAARAAVEANDDPRIITWGERVLARQPDDLQFLERVARALSTNESRETSERALKYAVHWEELLRGMEKDGGRSGMSPADWRNQLDRALARAMLVEARSTGNLGRMDDAAALSGRAFETFPSAEAARELSRWEERRGKPAEAAQAMADAFTVPDVRSTDALRERDRARLGELYRKAHGSETGLGDLLLESYDRNVALVHTRELRLRAADPNSGLTDPMQFTLSGLENRKLNLVSLKGKVVILDFWATWCVPCRQQHILLERVKKQFADDSGVVFLSISTDEDRKLVQPFLQEAKWTDEVYFEDGLTRALAIRSIPTTVVTDRAGGVFSRLVGFSPQRYVDMLVQRIRDARSN
jgi:thiol-disulfide isomerase/thioredoxin